jgi:hypothetical protein
LGLATDNNVRGFAYIRYSDYEWHFMSLQRAASLKYKNWSYPAVNVKPNDVFVFENHAIHGMKAFGSVWSAGGTGFLKWTRLMWC